jgi:quercetin dioxygenase-like cupin family protein
MHVVLAGELEVTVEGSEPQVLTVGGLAHVPAETTHSYRNITDDAHFLTIVTRGSASGFFTEVATEVEMSPPDIPGVIRVAASHGVEFIR